MSSNPVAISELVPGADPRCIPPKAKFPTELASFGPIDFACAGSRGVRSCEYSPPRWCIRARRVPVVLKPVMQQQPWGAAHISKRPRQEKRRRAGNAQPTRLIFRRHTTEVIEQEAAIRVVPVAQACQPAWPKGPWCEQGGREKPLCHGCGQELLLSYKPT